MLFRLGDAASLGQDGNRPDWRYANVDELEEAVMPSSW